ncbi:MAG TPA: Do family serine endopeptidase, partial [Spirochaetota bacterium]|nr:Do family serine endopeptidase [Spirochaetota bacterium]
IFGCKSGYANNNSDIKNDVNPVFKNDNLKNISDLQSNLHNIAKNETPSVVFIGTEKSVTQDFVDPFDFFFNDPRNRRDQIDPKKKEFKQKGLGSGVIYRKKENSYYILTNNHVIEKADKIKVTVDQNKSYDAKLVGTDPATDIAIIVIETKDALQIAKFGDSDNLQVGDFVIAIGNPYGLSGTMTFGIISALGRTDIGQSNFTNFIQTDASINPGNSGGPLLNIDGEVIGINSMIYSQSGGNVGIGFAIPVNLAKKISDEFIDKGKKDIDRGWLGVYFQELTEEMIATLDIKGIDNGMLVSRVFEDSPAEKAEIKTGDILLEVNGKKLKKTSDLTMTVANASPGTKMTFKILRDGKTITKDVMLGNRKDMDMASESLGTALSDYGLELSELSQSFRDKNKIPSVITGVVVLKVQQGSRANQAGIEEGDVIFKVNNKRINNISELTKFLNDNKDKQNYFFIFKNGRESIVMM